MLFTKEEWDIVLFFTARTMAYHPGVYQKIEKIYQKNEMLFYQLAKQHPLRNCRVMSAMPLQYEIKTSHMLGIIVAAEEDDELKSEIIRQLKILYPNYFEYLQHPNEKSSRNMTREQNQMRHMQPYSSLYGAYFLNFLYDSPEKNAIFNSDPDLNRQYQRQLEIIYMRKWVVTPMELEENRAALIDKDLKRILNSWQSIDHFSRFVSCIEEYSDEMGWDIPLSSALQNHKDMVLSFIRIRLLDYDLMLYSNYTEKPENNAAITKLEDIYFTLAHLCKWAGYNLDETNRSELKKQEQNDLIQLSKVYKGNRQNRFSIEKYVYNLFIFRLLQEYKKAKELYFQDNEEYRLLEEKQKQTEILALQNQLQELTQKNNRLIEENQSLQEENQRLRALLLKTEQETQKNYKQQISDMDQQIKDQQKKLYDLVPLREFIFSLENIEHFSEIPISLQDYSKAARIAILGGHENLRKKIKQNYPEFLVMDGTLKSLDFFALLQNIDILFLFTEHMSHAVYYNAVAAAERYKVKLIYVRVTNMEIIERKMAEEIKLWIENYNK